MPQKKLFIAGTIGGVISFFLIGFMMLNLVSNVNSGLTPQQKREIFAGIIKNNSNSLFGRNSGTSELATSTADSTTLAAPLIYRPDNQDYNYRHTTMTYSDGPAVQQCKFFNSAEGGGYYKSESFEYYGDNNYYSKYINTDVDNDLTSYSITRTTPDNSESIEYRGGSYAVQWDYNLSILRTSVDSPTDTTLIAPSPTIGEGSAPVSAPDVQVPPEDNPVTEPEVDYDAIIAQYFGPDADIIDVITQNGKSYYVVQYTYLVDCSMEISPLKDSVSSTFDTSSQTKIVVQNIVDSVTFEYVKSSNYLESVSNQNLLNSYSTAIETKTTALDQVVSEFNFDYSVEIRKLENIEYDSEKEVQNMVNFLSQNEYTLLLLANTEAELQSAYSQEASQKYNLSSQYLYDRNFYPNSAKGEAMFNSYVESTGLGTTPIVNITYAFNPTSTYDFVNINIYNQSINWDDILGTSESDVKSTVNISVDGQLVAATLHTYTYETMVDVAPSPATEPTTQIDPIAPDRGNYVSRQLVVEYDGFKYVIYLPSSIDFDITTLKFKSLKTNNTTELTTWGNELSQVYKNISTRNGNTGVSVPEGKPL